MAEIFIWNEVIQLANSETFYGQIEVEQKHKTIYSAVKSSID